MFREGQILYGLVVAVDIENFSRLDIRDQPVLLARLKEVLRLAAERARLDSDAETAVSF